MPQGQRGLVLGSGQLRTALPGRVVEAQLLVAAGAALAVGQRLALEAGVHRGVVVALEPGGGVAGGGGAPTVDLVVLCVLLATAVVDRTDHHRAVDIAFQERHQHFLPTPRQHHAAPVVAGPRGHHPHPGPGASVGRGVVVAAGMGQAAAGVAAALPRELHLDAMVAVGQQRVAVADHDRAERASDGRPWMQVRAVAVLGLWPVVHFGGDGDEAVVVERGGHLPRRLAVGQPGQRVRQRRHRHAGRTQGLFQSVEHVGIEVVARLVQHRQAQELCVLADLRVLRQAEARTGRQCAPLAGAVDGMGAHAQRVQMLLRAALAACVVLPAIGAAGITVDNAQVVALPGLGAGLATLQGAVVPGRTFDLARPPAVRGGPLLHAVAALALVAAMEAHAAQLRGVVAVVGQHQGVRAEVRAAGLAGMLEPVIDALLGQQPLDEGKIAFLVLRGQAAPCVLAGVTQRPAPGRCQPAVVGEQVFDDLDHGLVVEDVAVHPLRQERQPRLQAQPIARQAAIAAQPLGGGDAAMQRAQAAVGLLQLQQRALPDQRRQLQAGVQRQRGDRPLETHAVDLLDAIEGPASAARRLFTRSNVLRLLHEPQ
ncbi:hypothetical protein G6F50_012633 [Rhizopus delemar]|uniref:Uncharacterized protein n=1 Tax=Rhizopus delemar TaxID=936053 RepID=A0A9P6YQQ8_9FUNG|nr:hypothetical protein G6F50_012633 [Rhizopus delemar]